VVGIVIVSHSRRLAEGAADLARQMGGDGVVIETAGGMDDSGQQIGTDAMLVLRAIESAWSDDGVIVLMDLGSAVLSAEMALDFLDEERRGKVLLTDAPLVEGAVAAAVTAKLGSPLERVAAEARDGLAGKAAHLGSDVPGLDEARPAQLDGPEESIKVVVDLPHGLHARPAARLVQTTSAFDADVTVRNVTSRRGPVSGRSLNAVATLGVSNGQTIEVTATGPAAERVVEAVRALAARRFDESFEDLQSDATAPVAPVAPAEAKKPAAVGELRGLPASPGIAIAPARRFHTPTLVPPPDEGSAGAAAELERLEDALERTRADVEAQREEAASRLGDARAAIFDAHALFLRDDELIRPTREAIQTGQGASTAWNGSIERTAAAWDRLEDPYLRARAADLRSVGAQVLARLLGVKVPGPTLDRPGILVADNLEPAVAAALDPATCIGIATAHGGPTSHAAVLARAMGIPAVVGAGDGIETIAEGTTLGLDGSTGVIRIDPDAQTVADLTRRRDEQRGREQAARAHALEPARTLDGVTIEVAANIGGPGEVPAAVAAGADAVGLFRSEFLFFGRTSLPDEEEQEGAYRRAAVTLDGRPIVVRTLDAGADKPLPYLRQAPEPNPFLGVRGIRLGLARPEVLDVQLRALARVAADHPVRILFPMIATVSELRAATEALDRAAAATGAKQRPEVGVMIEIPSAALLAAHLAVEVDFFSIGTNDLTQYTLAADRGNDAVAGLADPLHPAVLRLIGLTCEGAAAHGAWVGVCGELAGDPPATAVLLGLGVTELSMSAPAIPSVKEAVRAVALPQAHDLAARAIAVSSAEVVRELLSGA
jgi:multiphosphoryl transfer protein